MARKTSSKTTRKRTAAEWREIDASRHRDTQTLIRLTAHDKAQLVALADHMGLSMNDVVMLLVRAEFRKQGLAG